VVSCTCTGAEAGAFRRVPVAAHIGAICVSVLAIVAVATCAAAAAAAASTNRTLRHAHEPFLQARMTGCESLQQQSSCMSPSSRHCACSLTRLCLVFLPPAAGLSAALSSWLRAVWVSFKACSLGAHAAMILPRTTSSLPHNTCLYCLVALTDTCLACVAERRRSLMHKTQQQQQQQQQTTATQLQRTSAG
jgi:hypothetical protein